MSNRITIKDLEAVVKRINIITNSPLEPYTKSKDGKYKANVGNYHLDGAYGGYALHRMAEGGGIHDILHCGHAPKREILHLMHAYIRGLQENEQ